MPVGMVGLFDAAHYRLDAMEKQQRDSERQMEAWRPRIAMAQQSPVLKTWEWARVEFLGLAVRVAHALSANESRLQEFRASAEVYRQGEHYNPNALSYHLRVLFEGESVKKKDSEAGFKPTAVLLQRLFDRMNDRWHLFTQDEHWPQEPGERHGESQGESP